MKLADVGERWLVEEILRPRYGVGARAAAFGHDVATVLAATGDVEADESRRYVVATTDPCPVPAARMLGEYSLYYWGWLLAAINLSDVAASGTTPAALLTSLELPSALEVDDLTELLDGLDACCRSVRTDVVGGNLREGPAISLGATAIGTSPTPPLSRVGSVPGDLLIAIGYPGRFWAGLLADDLGEEVVDGELMRRAILTPRPLVDVGMRLRQRHLVHACTDSSDGLQPSLLDLASASNLRAHVDRDAVVVDKCVQRVAEAAGIDPFRLALGFGDWLLVCAAPAANLSAIEDAAAESDVDLVVLGSMEEGAGVGVTAAGCTGDLLPLASERFRPDSVLSDGLAGYRRRLMHDELVIPGTGR